MNILWFRFLTFIKFLEYEYRFLVDGQWRNDPANDQLCANCFGGTNNIMKIK